MSTPRLTDARLTEAAATPRVGVVRRTDDLVFMHAVILDTAQHDPTSQVAVMPLCDYNALTAKVDPFAGDAPQMEPCHECGKPTTTPLGYGECFCSEACLTAKYPDITEAP